MENVFERIDEKSAGTRISSSLYNLTIGLVLCWGFFINWLMVKYIPYYSLAGISPFFFIIAYFASCFYGVFLFTKSNKAIVSFIGYNFVVIPFGVVINLVVYQYDSALVLDAIRVTGFVTLFMMILGTVFPLFFQRIAGALTIALLAVIIIELIEIFLLRIHHGIIDWIVVLIFCGYVGVDWGRANRIPKTFDNAVDSAASLYMDIINLFLRILSILGRRK
ncbi:Bax inhibitor-1 family protein [Candidatus Latescibacterota bacterium]